MITTALRTSDVQALEQRHVLQTYRRQPVVFVRGEGVRLYDVDGREYLDLLSGIGVASLGHAHPGLARAIADQAQTLMHTSNLFFHPLQGQLAERLAGLSGLPRAFFCNSGAEAVEACLKFARRYWYTRGEARDRDRRARAVVSRTDDGRAVGHLGRALPRAVRAAAVGRRRGCRRTIRRRSLQAVSTRTAAIIAEPIQGEGGVRPLTPAFADAISEACATSGALLIADEIQSGLGRTGHPFYFTALGMKPHLVSLGKALGGGVPIGAALISEEVASTIAYGDHGSTYGGNLLACRAALCVLDELVAGGLITQIGRVGRFFDQRLRAMAAKHPIVKEVRGAGLIWGIELTRDAAPVVPAALERGVIVNRTAERVVRLLPPLVITEADADVALGRLDAALAAVAEEGGPQG